MPSTLIDSTILGNLVGTEAMRAVFSDDNRTQRYLDVEAALARVEGRLGVIPQAAAAEIERNCRVERIDMAKLRAQTERAGSPVVGVVQQLASLCTEPHGRYCHWGATTQDITDTATVLQMREAFALVDAELAAIAGALAGLARRYRDTPMAGRSHLQQAAPITFGYKAACLLSAIERHRARRCGRLSAQHRAEGQPRRRHARRLGRQRDQRVGRSRCAGRPAQQRHLLPRMESRLRLGQPHLPGLPQLRRLAIPGDGD